MMRSLLVLCAFLASFNTHAAFTSVWVFGDSLADSGNAFIATAGATEPFPYMNLVPSLPYPSGTFSDGPVWVQHLAGSLGLPLLPLLGGGTNFAIGGARTGLLPSIGASPDPFAVINQAGLAASIGSLPTGGLYIVGGGGNDVRAAGEYVAAHPLDPAAPADAMTAMAEGANNLAAAISALAGAGAERFVVPNLPDVGRTPSLLAQGPVAAGFASALVNEFNTQLVAALPGVEVANPGISIITLDTFGLINAIFADPAAFGLSNVTDACTLQNGGTTCADPSQYLFWDGIHPTTVAHRISADAALAAIVPLPGAVWSFATGLFMLAGVAGRKGR